MQPVKIKIGAKGIIVEPPLVKIPKKAVDEIIEWTISTPGWKFTEDGVVIHWNFNQFKNRKGSKNQKFNWTSRNTNTGRYEYTIKVTNGTTVASRDPGIKNGGR